MKKTMVIIGADILLVDTIEYKGGLWLVAEWRDNKAEGWSKPARIIAMAGLGQQPMTGAADYLLSEPIPKAVFEGREKQRGIAVEVNPDITFPYLPGLH